MTTNVMLNQLLYSNPINSNEKFVEYKVSAAITKRVWFTGDIEMFNNRCIFYQKLKKSSWMGLRHNDIYYSKTINGDFVKYAKDFKIVYEDIEKSFIDKLFLEANYDSY